MRNSPEFAKNPMGKYVDPDKMVAAREAGASPWCRANRRDSGIRRQCAGAVDDAVLEFLVAIQTLIEFPKSGLIAIPL